MSMTKGKNQEFVIAGIDEAGRGAVIGPLVIAGISIDSRKERALKKIKVKDSKLLTPKRRVALAKKIEKIAKDVVVIKVDPCKIDSMRMFGTNLNRIEAVRFLDAIAFLKPHKVYIDGFDTNLEKLKKFLSKMTNGLDMVVEHEADVNYPVVSAASIIAKVERDRQVEKLKTEYGDIGSGYPSDPRTVQWLKNWLEKNKDWPECVRKSWVTAEVLQEEKRQLNLSAWLKKIKGNKEEPC